MQRGEKEEKMDGASEKEEDLVGAAAAAAIKERGEAGEESAN